MKPADVPAELLDTACAQFFGTPPEPGDNRDGMARALAAVLPIHAGQLVRQLANQAAGLAVGGPEGFGLYCGPCTEKVLDASDEDVDALTVLGALFGHLLGETHAANTAGGQS